MTQDLRLDRLEGVVEQMNLRLTSIENRLSSLESRVNSLEGRMMQMFLALLGVQITTFVTLFVAILLTRAA
jgi:hypothetical protein